MGGLFKYADDSNITTSVWKDGDRSEEMVQQFLEWSRVNNMKSNPEKCFGRNVVLKNISVGVWHPTRVIYCYIRGCFLGRWQIYNSCS